MGLPKIVFIYMCFANKGPNFRSVAPDFVSIYVFFFDSCKQQISCRFNMRQLGQRYRTCTAPVLYLKIVDEKVDRRVNVVLLYNRFF